MKYEIIMPNMGEGIENITILKVLKKKGDTVVKNEKVIEFAMDKVDSELPSEFDGVVQEILVKEEDEITIGTVLMVLEIADEKRVEPTVLPLQKEQIAVVEPSILIENKTAQVVDNQLEMHNNSNVQKRSTPLARMIARDLNIDLSSIETTNSSILKADVLAKFKEKTTPSVQTNFGSFKPKVLPDFSKFGIVRHEKMSSTMRSTTENLQATWSNVPHAWITEKVDMTKIEALREQFTIKMGEKDRRMTSTVFITKAVARVLRQPQFAVFNASLDLEKQEIIYKDFINMGIAVDTERGLLVPVIRDCDRKGLKEISIELTEIATRTRNKQNTPEDMKGGTFTISNIGGIGGTGILPIVNAPEVAILGVAAAHTEGVWDSEKKAFEPRLMMPITIGFDHRLINGAAATRFLVEVKKLLEEPFLMQMC